MNEIPTKRLRELGMDPDGAWAWLRTIDPIDRRDSTVAVNVMGHRPFDPDALRFTHAVETQPSMFGPEWHGHHYEAIGFPRRLAPNGEPYFQATTPLPPGRLQGWQSVNRRTGRPEFDILLRWQRAYRPTDVGDEPPLVAELHWWPGLEGSWPFFRVTTEHDHNGSLAELHAAERARALLNGLQPSLDQGGRPERFDDTNEPLFFKELSDAAHTAVRCGERVNPSSLARHGLASRPIITKAVERFHYDLDALEAEAVRCTQKLSFCTVIWRWRAKFKKNRG